MPPPTRSRSTVPLTAGTIRRIYASDQKIFEKDKHLGDSDYHRQVGGYHDGPHHL
ncbi:hypothetical protein ACFYRL_13490 [Streptomyces goshikiensis]|uniref:hypothetical protein n=1 Tax=Streptomyces goshikiensis TaxID=1942 RepID=UPI0036C03890